MSDTKTFVMRILESYANRERKIAVLRYELEYPVMVGKMERLEAINFRHSNDMGYIKGDIFDKTLYIALNYEEQADHMNAQTLSEIAGELFDFGARTGKAGSFHQPSGKA